jgi:hypothetical protein
MNLLMMVIDQADTLADNSDPAIACGQSPRRDRTRPRDRPLVFLGIRVS